MKLYSCHACGGSMEWDGATGGLKCRNCGTLVKVQDAEALGYHPYETLPAFQSLQDYPETVIQCPGCGAEIKADGKTVSMGCPYCGAKLTGAAVPESRNEEAEKWIRKALSVNSYPERKKILTKGLEACPDSREIRWELLFIGEPETKRTRDIDFSIIKCWVLEMYRNPRNFTDDKKDRMRAQFFDAPELIRTLNQFANPEEKQREYLQRLCREYVELFLEGSNEVMGSLFGFRNERNKEKKLAIPVAQIIKGIRADEKLLPEQREQLWKAVYQAYGTRTDGKMACLDEYLKEQ